MQGRVEALEDFRREMLWSLCSMRIDLERDMPRRQINKKPAVLDCREDCKNLTRAPRAGQRWRKRLKKYMRRNTGRGIRRT